MPARPASEDIIRARQGDREALDRVLARNHGRLSRLAEACLGDRLKGLIRPSDLLQSAYLDVVKTVEDFQGESEETFVTWVARILEHNVRDKRRYFDARKRRPLEFHEPVAAAETLADPRQGTPSSLAAAGEDLLLVDRAAESLSEDYRRILHLCVREGRSHEEAAVTMGRSPVACRILLSRARAALVAEVSRQRRHVAANR